MSTTPTVEREGDGVRFVWLGERIRIDFDYLRERQEGVQGGLIGEITVRTLNSTGEPAAHLHWARLTLSSSSGRDDLANMLGKRTSDTGRAKDSPFDWGGMLEYACAKAAQIFREGEPFVDLSTMPRPPRLTYLVEKLIPLGQTAVLYSKGASGKSLLAMALALAVRAGLPLPGGLWPKAATRVLYLDYEADEEEQCLRLDYLARGLHLAAVPPVVCRHQTRPLAADMGRLRQEVARREVGLVIVDSIAYALGGKAIDADVCIEAFNALRSLGNQVSRLVIAHIPKSDKEAKAASIFGCYSEDTEVLTRSGWKRHDAWQRGEEIACFDKDHSIFCWRQPEQRWEYDYDGDMIHVHTASSDALVTPNHNLVVESAWRPNPHTIAPHPARYPRGWRLAPADSLRTSFLRTPYANPFEEDGAERGTFNLPGFGTVPMDGFLEILGWFVSEGSIRRDPRTRVIRGINLTQVTGAKAERIRTAIAASGLPFGGRECRYVYPGREHEQPVWQWWSLKSSEWARWFATECGDSALTKQLPSFVFDLSARQKRILLDAMIEGDGTRLAGENTSYATISPRLADDLQRLALLLGHPSRITQANPGMRGTQTRFCVRIGRRDRRKIGLHAENRTVEHYAGKVYCFTVPTGAYLTRRRGAIAVHGNSVFQENAGRCIWEMQSIEDKDGIAIGLYPRKKNWGKKDNPFGLRFVFDDDDESVVLKPYDLKDDAELLGHAALPYQIVTLLTDGQARTRKQITDELGANDNSVKQAIRRLEVRGDLHQYNGKPGRGHEASYVLEARQDDEETPF